MNKIFLLGLLLLCWACSGKYDRAKIVELKTAYNYQGLDTSYSIDMNKKRVISYIGPKGSFADLLATTPIGKIDKIIKDNPDFDIIFYIDRIEKEDTTYIKNILKNYNCKFTVLLDFDSEYYKQNESILNPMKSGRLTKISHICDRDGRVRGLAVIGTRMSVFDPIFARTKRYMR